MGIVLSHKKITQENIFLYLSMLWLHIALPRTKGNSGGSIMRKDWSVLPVRPSGSQK